MINTSQIPQLMERLVQVMKEKDLSAPKYLNPGLSRQEILDLTKGIIELPEDVIAFYQFTNGVTIPERLYYNWEFEIMSGYIILPLQKALDERKQIIEQMYESDEEWIEESEEDPNGWLPILAEDGNCYLVDVNHATEDEPCVFHIMKACDPYIAYVSLASMLQTIIACYEQNAYIIADGRVVDYDDAKEKTIAALHNPGIDM